MLASLKRTEKLISIVGFTTLVIIPIECVRVFSIGASIFLLLLFSGGEYIITGESTNTEIFANNIENYGKEQIEKLAKKMGIDGKIY